MIAPADFFADGLLKGEKLMDEVSNSYIYFK